MLPQAPSSLATSRFRVIYESPNFAYIRFRVGRRDCPERLTASGPAVQRLRPAVPGPGTRVSQETCIQQPTEVYNILYIYKRI